MDIVTKLEDAYAFLGDPLHREAANEIERLREENKRLRELNQHKTMQGRLDGRTVILHQSGDVWVPHWQEDPEVQGGK